MFERAAELRPRDARTWGNLADAQRWVPGNEAVSAEMFDRAIALSRQHLADDGNDGEAWSQLGKWLAKRGEFAPALDATRRALGIGCDNVAIRARAITVYELAGCRAEALVHLAAVAASGYSRMELENDPELEALRADPGVRALLGGSGPSGH